MKSAFVLTGFFAVALAAPKVHAAANPDGKIAASVIAANEAEVKAGETAEKMAKNSEVKAFAKHMVTEHSDNNKQAEMLTKKLSVKPEADASVDQMKKDSEKTISELKTHKDKSFDKAYMESQVSMHEKVLAKINNDLLPMVSRPEMKTFLETTRAHVEQHLAQAKDLAAKIQ